MNRPFILTTALVLSAALASTPAAEKSKVLLIGKDRDHAFTTHEYMADCELLARCLRQTPGIEAVVSNGWPTDPKVLEGVDAIVLHTRRGGDVLLGGPQRRHVEQLLKNGVGLTAIHWSTGADQKDITEQWQNTLGGWFHTDFSRYLVRTARVAKADPDHPIGRGWEPFELRDEYYIQLRHAPEIKPVMTAHIDGKDHPIAWVYERADGGRSFGFVCGHFHANFGEQPFRQALVNGIVWTLHREIPAAGAPCAITPRDMELPPDTRKPK